MTGHGNMISLEEIRNSGVRTTLMKPVLKEWLQSAYLTHSENWWGEENLQPKVLYTLPYASGFASSACLTATAISCLERGLHQESPDSNSHRLFL